jgi:hypothetical protein
MSSSKRANQQLIVARYFLQNSDKCKETIQKNVENMSPHVLRFIVKKIIADSQRKRTSRATLRFISKKIEFVKID